MCGSERLAFPEDFTQLGLALRHENHGRVDSVQTALDIFLEPEIMPADFRWVCDNADCPSPRQRPTLTHNLQQNQTFCVSNSNGGVTTLPQERKLMKPMTFSVTMSYFAKDRRMIFAV